MDTSHLLCLVLDDELDPLREIAGQANIVDLAAVRIHRLAQSTSVLHLLPTGQRSMGVDILKE